MQRIIPATIALLLFTTLHSGLFAQQRPIGYWRSHLPYNNARSVATDGGTIFVATDIGFFTYDVIKDELAPYSKVEGMSDLKTVFVGHDILTETTVIGYENSNIDLFRDNSFYNIPYLKLKNVSGSKSINNIFTENGFAYVSTGIGVLSINLEKREVKETYAFSKNSQLIPTLGFSALGNFFYVVTPQGMFRANRNSANLQAQSAWQQIGTGRSLNYIAAIQNKIFVSGMDSLFVLNADTLQYIYRTDTGTSHLDPGRSELLISVFKDGLGVVRAMNTTSYQVTDTFIVPYPKQVLQLSDNTIYVADQYGGMAKIKGRVDKQYYVPQGPFWYGAFGIYAEDNRVAVAHGSFSDKYAPGDNPFGLSYYNSSYWVNYSGYTFKPFADSVKDIVSVTKNPSDGSLWFGSLQSGFFILRSETDYQLVFKGSGLKPQIGEPDKIPANSIAFDRNGTAWITQHQAANDLVAWTKEGNWYYFNSGVPRAITGAGAGLLIDNADQKWFYSPLAGSPVVIMYNDNGTIDYKGDDQVISFSSPDIPGTQILSMVKEKSGVLWIGTSDGIARINCPEQVLEGACKPETPIVQFDQFAGKLFQGERVNTIAVDGANRKWIGTNNGIWLLSPDGDKIVLRFTAENSPLPSNVIQKIAVDGITGDVYVGTDNGLISYRSTATDGGTENSNVTVFPNPVPTGYTGTVAIRGVTENADVRITDIAGQLVYRTKALGGQAVWSGLDYTGHRPQTGVYLIFVTNKDGSQRHVGKLVFME